jgi:hypothetical protein
MEITDIIQTDRDRLFIVDPECYILFTGDSTDDIKPFIRIGNWINMPVELIPLVENIIVTDTLAGNPSLEQFNIDIQLLQENRYIGSRNIVNRYLEFQKIFGLDLTNTTIVDIEKDIPEITREQISTKNHFTGVFYRNGNVRILHGDELILDLHGVAEETVNYQAVFDRISEQSAGTNRYAGSGMIIIDHDPFFHHRHDFTTYLFPTYLFADFSRLGIDPARIRNLIYPSTNFINLTKILKWLNASRGRINLYHDNETMVEPVKKLFSDARIHHSDFSGMSIESEGMTVSAYPDSFNIRLCYDTISPDGSTLTLAYIKAPGGIKKIIKDGPQGIIVNYSVYEDINLLLRASGPAVIVLPDGNANTSLLLQSGVTVLKEGLHYEFRVAADPSYLWDLSGFDRHALTEALADRPGTSSEKLDALLEAGSDLSPGSRITNLLSLLLLELNTTTDRDYARDLQNLITALKTAGHRIHAKEAFSTRAYLVFHRGAVYEFHGASPEEQSVHFFEDVLSDDDRQSNYDRKQMTFFERIDYDRRRLQLLLAMFHERSRESGKEERDLAPLKELIEKRKEEYHSNDISTALPPSLPPIIPADEVRTGGTTRPEPAPEALSPRAAFKTALKSARTKKRPIGFLAALVLALLAAAAIFMLTRQGVISARKSPIKQDDISTTTPDEEDIHIDDRDIYRYANNVAIKNGYSPLTYAKFKEKNPDWIYPSNVFTMLDGDRITVKSGDTLWHLARKKLVSMEKEFNRLIDEAATTEDRAARLKLVKHSRDFAFRKGHFDKIEMLERETAR